MIRRYLCHCNNERSSRPLFSTAQLVDNKKIMNDVHRQDIVVRLRAAWEEAARLFKIQIINWYLDHMAHTLQPAVVYFRILIILYCLILRIRYCINSIKILEYSRLKKITVPFRMNPRINNVGDKYVIITSKELSNKNNNNNILSAIKEPRCASILPKMNGVVFYASTDGQKNKFYPNSTDYGIIKVLNR